MTEPVIFEISVNPEFRNLSEDSRVFLHDTLVKFVVDSVNKFIAGQKEHGGSILDRPALPELYNEQIDSVFYLAALKKQLENDSPLDKIP